jgi:hypothetical protein
MFDFLSGYGLEGPTGCLRQQDKPFKDLKINMISYALFIKTGKYYPLAEGIL